MKRNILNIRTNDLLSYSNFHPFYPFLENRLLGSLKDEISADNGDIGGYCNSTESLSRGNNGEQNIDR